MNQQPTTTNLPLSCSTEGYEQPVYPDGVMRRIYAARVRAHETKRNAWWVGRSPRTGAACYMVLSTHGSHAYYLQVFNHPNEGGYCYQIERGGQPVVWIRCECEASLNQKPCTHAARVELRLEREWQLAQLEQRRKEKVNKDG